MRYVLETDVLLYTELCGDNMGMASVRVHDLEIMAEYTLLL